MGYSSASGWEALFFLKKIMTAIKPIKSNAVSTEVVQAVDSVQTVVLHQFNNVLDREPSKTWVRKNSITNSNYIPIRIVETLLRSIFGVYQTEMIGEPKLIGNSVTVSVQLTVYHPVLKEWVTHTGLGSVPIQVKKGASPVDFTQIHATALHKNAPAALGFAISNAAKKFGRIFGSSLNAEPGETISPINVWENIKKEVEDNE